MKKALNRKRLFAFRDTGRRVIQAAAKNFEGGYSYRELKKIAGIFNSFSSLETRTRVDCLKAIFSAKIMTKILVGGTGEYIPEKVSDLQQVFLGGEQEQDNFFSKKRIAVLDPLIVAYDPKKNDPRLSRDPRSRWNRDWELHVKSIKSLEIKKEAAGACSLFINL